MLQVKREGEKTREKEMKKEGRLLESEIESEDRFRVWSPGGLRERERERERKKHSQVKFSEKSCARHAMPIQSSSLFLLSLLVSSK